MYKVRNQTMSINYTELKESIRLKNGKLKLKAVAVSGKDGDTYVVVSPTLLVSGYGETEIEAKQSFEENVLLFCEDFMALSSEQKDGYAKSLGFDKVKYHSKDYSKAYVDENGILKGLDLGKLTISTMETSTAC